MANASGEHFFEGTEKLLEVWFSSSDPENYAGDLRDVDREDWEELLKQVKCEIISEKRDNDMVAYVLSESSMFISKDRFILKTCGTTTLLYAVKPLLKLVKESCGLNVVKDIFYSRKNFMKPELQKKPHQRWDEEVEHLDSLFDDGAAYVLGRMNSECWYLYTIDNVGVQQGDQTLELLMTELDPDIMQIFSVEKSGTSCVATKESGIFDLIPGTVIDDFLFDPCGYSMNGILPGGHYFTIHITPEPHCSYVSFESNVPQESYFRLINAVLELFRPGKFLLTIFANKDSVALDCSRNVSNMEFCNFVQVENQLCHFKNYNLGYCQYKRPPSQVTVK